MKSDYISITGSIETQTAINEKDVKLNTTSLIKPWLSRQVAPFTLNILQGNSLLISSRGPVHIK